MAKQIVFETENKQVNDILKAIKANNILLDRALLDLYEYIKRLETKVDAYENDGGLPW